jgi:signal transduction histidine kinase
MDRQFGEPLTSEVTTALIELAALARQAGWAPPAQRRGVASDLLDRLLALCGAERGALLLPAERGTVDQSEPPRSGAAKHTKTFRALALRNVPVEEAAALLTALLAEDESGLLLGTTGWMAYRFPLDEGRAGDLQRGLTPPGNSFGRAESAREAFLVIGWTDEPGLNGASAPQAARCSALLPMLADAAGAVISALLLNKRLHEVEHTSVREALEGMELLKAELLGTVSHELRSPLASIKGYAATLLRHEHRLPRDERHQFLLAINEASDRLEAIVERLLEVSQLETGQIALQRSLVDVVRLANEAMTAMQERVEASSPGRFAFHPQEQGDGVPTRAVPLVLADPRRLREVLDNLLENAVTYSPEGGIISMTVRLVAQTSSEAGDEGAVRTREGRSRDTAHAAPRQMLEICVCDQGLGIPAEQLERVFDRFHRVDSSLTRETGGLGLGLTICKRIVELHGGTIWAEHGPQGRGSALYVRLPIEAGAQL